MGQEKRLKSEWSTFRTFPSPRGANPHQAPDLAGPWSIILGGGLLCIPPLALQGIPVRDCGPDRPHPGPRPPRQLSPTDPQGHARTLTRADASALSPPTKGGVTSLQDIAPEGTKLLDLMPNAAIRRRLRDRFAFWD